MAYTRVNWENLPSTNTPLNATNLNIMDKEIKDADNAMTYSTTETVVGTWLGKTLYRKVISGTIASGLNTISINASYDDVWVDLGHSFIKGSNRVTPLARADNRSENYSVGAVVDVSGNQVFVITGSDSSLAGTAYITVEYTKSS